MLALGTMDNTAESMLSIKIGGVFGWSNAGNNRMLRGLVAQSPVGMDWASLLLLVWLINTQALACVCHLYETLSGKIKIESSNVSDQEIRLSITILSLIRVRVVWAIVIAYITSECLPFWCIAICLGL